MGGSQLSVNRISSRAVTRWPLLVACLAWIACGGGKGSGKGADHPAETDNGEGEASGGGDQADDRAGDQRPFEAGPDNPADDDDDNGKNGDNGGQQPDNPADDDDDNGSAATPADGGDGGAAAKPAPAESARFKTSIPPDKMSDYLVKPAKAAMKKQNWALAISLYRGLVTARGPGAPEAIELAKAWTLAGQYESAREVLADFIAATTDVAAKKAAIKERDRLATAKNPFASQRFQVTAADKEAGKAFKDGRAAFKKKKYADALLYYRMGSALAPDMPGFLRELGATYDKLGAEAEKTLYYQKYLRDQPFGKNAQFVRTALAKVKGATGKLTIKSALPCEDFWMQAQHPGSKLPIKDLVVPPGTYEALCLNYKFQMAYYETAKVEAGKSATLSFDWAILVNELTNPFGRIAIESALDGSMIQLALARPEQGVVVPKDGRALRMVLSSLDGVKKDTRFIKLQPGQREVIKW